MIIMQTRPEYDHQRAFCSSKLYSTAQFFSSALIIIMMNVIVIVFNNHRALTEHTHICKVLKKIIINLHSVVWWQNHSTVNHTILVNEFIFIRLNALANTLFIANVIIICQNLSTFSCPLRYLQKLAQKSIASVTLTEVDCYFAKLMLHVSRH